LALIDYKYRGKSGSWKAIQWEVGMAEPLKAILTIAAVCSGLYVINYSKSIISTGQITTEQFLWIAGSFTGVTALGLLIWGMVALVQRAAHRRKSSSLNTRNYHM
jgi:hypothetical protein